VSASSQRCNFPVRTHSPENPEPTWNLAPTGGASPDEARHTISPSSDKAIAAPEERVNRRARLAIKSSPAYIYAPNDSTSWRIAFSVGASATHCTRSGSVTGCGRSGSRASSGTDSASSGTDWGPASGEARLESAVSVLKNSQVFSCRKDESASFSNRMPLRPEGWDHTT